MPLDPRRVVRLKCPVSSTVYTNHSQQPLYATTSLYEWLVMKIVMDACQKRIVVNRHGVPSPEDGGEWEQV